MLVELKPLRWKYKSVVRRDVGIVNVKSLAKHYGVIVGKGMELGEKMRNLYIEIKPRSGYFMTDTDDCYATYKIGNKLVVPVFCRAYGDALFIISEQRFRECVNTAKDFSKKKPSGVWIVSYPYMKVDIVRVNVYTFKMTIIDKWKDKKEFDARVERERAEIF